MRNFKKMLIPAVCGLAGLVAAAIPLAASADAIIGNGTIQLGINDQAQLNVPGGTPSSGTGTTVVGLRYLPTNGEATAPGCLCEGWGAGDRVTGISGYANEAIDGVVNLALVSFASTASTAKSVVNVGSTLQVTHDYHPAATTPNLYEVTVTIKNISAASVSPSYRRVMDWDAEPTAFSEFVTIQTGSSTRLKFDSDNGFETANPFGPRSQIQATGNFVDVGPADHGALFDFEFDPLAAGASTTFNIYYGAAGNEAGANTAIGAVGTEVFSYGQPNTDPAVGAPNTYIFAFSGVGGVAVRCGVPDTASGLMKLNNCFAKSGSPSGVKVISSTYSSKAVPEGAAGTYTNVVQYCNLSAQSLVGLVARTSALTNGNSLISRTANGPTASAPGGAGSQQSFVLADAYADGMLAGATATAAGECVRQTNVIGLTNRNKFTFTLDVIGDSPKPAP